jgi:hypothetical protein
MIDDDDECEAIGGIRIGKEKTHPSAILSTINLT